MAIKKGLRPTIAEVGKIKIGGKGKEITSKNGKKFQPPVRFDYFKITTTERDSSGNYIENKEIMENLGGKPKELRIRLPFDTVDKNFFTQYMCYEGNKKICSGDGEKATRIDGNGNAKEIECNTETCPYFQKGKCKVAGILSCFLADAKDVGGVHKFRTHGWNATASILGALEYFSENCGGILQGLPLKLVMIKKATQDHGTINYATVVIDGQEIRGLRKLAIEEKQNRAAMNVDMKQIEANAEASGFFKDTDPEEMIQEEYFPEDEDLKNVTPEPPKKGTTPSDLNKKLKEEKIVVGTPVIDFAKKALKDKPAKTPAKEAQPVKDEQAPLDIF